MTIRNYDRLKEYFQETYRDNSFVKLLEMKLAHIEPGTAQILMQINSEKHTNLYHVAHGLSLIHISQGIVR